MFGVVNAVESLMHWLKARGCKYWTVPPLNQSLGAGRSFPWLSNVPVQFSLLVQLPKVLLLWGRWCSRAGYWLMSGLGLVAELAKIFPPDLPPSSADVEKEFVGDASWVGQGKWECGTERAACRWGLWSSRWAGIWDVRVYPWGLGLW